MSKLKKIYMGKRQRFCTNCKHYKSAKYAPYDVCTRTEAAKTVYRYTGIESREGFSRDIYGTCRCKWEDAQ